MSPSWPWRPRNPLMLDLRELIALDTLTGQQHIVDGTLHSTVVGFQNGQAVVGETFVLEGELPRSAFLLGRRCSVCSVSWPDAQRYSPCPTCGEPTKRLRHRGESARDVLSAEQARDLIERGRLE